MPARLRPTPDQPASILTVVSKPLWFDRRGASHYCAVSMRTIDQWRADRLLPFSRVKGNIRIRIADCDALLRKRLVK
jgi:hypothetical protein